MIENILQKIRFLSVSKKEPYLLFYNILGFYPKNIGYYQLAIQHKSVPTQTKDGQELSNERLEFLGDSILNSVVTDIIYRRFEDKQEGYLTSVRAKIVSREFLNQLAIEIGLNKLVIASKYVNLHSNNNIYGNALEALIGAVYLDFGYRKCKRLIEDHFFCYHLDWNDITENETNFKSKLIEWCHKNQLEPEFILLNETVVKNKHTFRSSLKINDIIISEAKGNNKKESQQKASEIAYKKIQSDSNFLINLQKREEKNL